MNNNKKEFLEILQKKAGNISVPVILLIWHDLTFYDWCTKIKNSTKELRMSKKVFLTLQNQS